MIWFWAVSALIFLVPGALLACRSGLLWSRLGWGERILPAFLLSAAHYGAAHAIALALRPTLAFGMAVWAGLLGLTLIWSLARRPLRRAASVSQGASSPSSRPPVAHAEPGRLPAEPSGSRRSWLLAAPLLAFGFVAMLVEGGSLGFTHDSLDYAGYVNRILVSGRCDIASAAYPDDGQLAPDPRRGTFHFAGAMLCRLSGVAPVEMWRVFPTFLVPLALWVFFAAFRRLLQSAAVAAASLFFFVVSTFFTGDHYINNLAYASRLGWVYSWIGLWAVALYLDRDRFDHTPPDSWSHPLPHPGSGRAALVLIILAAPILLGIHILSAAQYLVSLGAFCWVWGFSRREPRPVRRTLLRLPVFTVLALLPFLWLKMRDSYAADNPLFDHRQGLLYLGGDWAVLGPHALANWFGWPGLLVLLLCLPMFSRALERRDMAFMAGGTAAFGLIVLNPIAVRLIEDARAHSLLFRVLLVAPYFQVLGYYTYWAIRRGREGRPRRLLLPALFLILAALTLTLHYRAAAVAWSKPQEFRAGLREVPALQVALARLQETDSTPRVVLSDPITSYAIPAYTHHYAMTPFHQHSSPADSRAIERMQDAQAVLSAYVPITKTLEVLREYDVRYILLNQSFRRYQSEYYTLISPVAYERQKAKFTARPEIFPIIHDRDGLTVFAFRDPGPAFSGDGRDLRDSFRVELAGVTQVVCDPPEGSGTVPDLDVQTRRAVADLLSAELYTGPSVGGLELLATRPDSAEVRRGSAIVIRTWWRRTGPMTLPVEAFVRFETGFPHPLFHHPLIGRPFRIWYERRHETAYRFGRSLGPLASVFPPYLWETGAIYAEGLYIPVLPHAAPGLYTIRLRLRELPFNPNLRLSDLLTVHDSLDGIVIGQIRIL